jgi:hypothetical protein
MLVLANINATPVASVTNAWYNSQMGNLAVFDGYLVQVNAKKYGRIYLSVTRKNNQNLLYDISDKTLIQLDPAIESMRTFLEKPATHLLQMEGSLTVEKEMKIGGKLEMKLEGFVNPYLKLFTDSAYIKTLVSGELKPDQIDKHDISGLSESRTRAELAYRPAPLKPASGGTIIFELPRFKNGFDAWDLTQYLGSGDTPIRLEHVLWENYSLSITVPPGYQLLNPVTDLVINNALGDLEISIRQEGNTIRIKRFWDLTKEVIPADQADDFRKMIQAWENPNWRKVVVKLP